MTSRRRRCAKAAVSASSSRVRRILAGHASKVPEDCSVETKDIIENISSPFADYSSQIEPSCILVGQLFDFGAQSLSNPELRAQLEELLDAGIIDSLTNCFRDPTRARRFRQNELHTKVSCLQALISILNFGVAHQDNLDTGLLPDGIVLNIIQSLDQASTILRSNDCSTTAAQGYISYIATVFSLFTCLAIVSSTSLKNALLSTESNEKTVVQCAIDASINLTSDQLPPSPTTASAMLRFLIACIHSHWPIPIDLSQLNTFITKLIMHLKSAQPFQTSLDLQVYSEWSLLLIQALKLAALLHTPEDAHQFELLKSQSTSTVIAGYLKCDHQTTGDLAMARLFFTETLAAQSDTDKHRSLSETFANVTSVITELLDTTDSRFDFHYPQILRALANIDNAIAADFSTLPTQSQPLLDTLCFILDNAKEVPLEASKELELSINEEELSTKEEKLSTSAEVAALPRLLADLPIWFKFPGVIFASLDHFSDTKGLQFITNVLEIMLAQEADSQLTDFSWPSHIEEFLTILGNFLINSQLDIKVLRGVQVALNLARAITLTVAFFGSRDKNPIAIRIKCTTILRDCLAKALSANGEWGCRWFGVGCLAEMMIGLIDILAEDEYHPIYTQLEIDKLFLAIRDAHQHQQQGLNSRLEKHPEERLAFERYLDSIENVEAFLQYKSTAA